MKEVCHNSFRKLHRATPEKSNKIINKIGIINYYIDYITDFLGFGFAEAKGSRPTGGYV